MESNNFKYCKLRVPSSCGITMQFLVTGYTSKHEYNDAIPVRKMINVGSSTVSMNSVSQDVANQVNQFIKRIGNVLSNAPMR